MSNFSMRPSRCTARSRQHRIATAYFVYQRQRPATSIGASSREVASSASGRTSAAKSHNSLLFALLRRSALAWASVQERLTARTASARSCSSSAPTRTSTGLAHPRPTGGGGLSADSKLASETTSWIGDHVANPRGTETWRPRVSGCQRVRIPYGPYDLF